MASVTSTLYYKRLQPSKSMTNAVFTVRLPPDLKTELDRLADATNRSKSYLATKAIAEYLKRNSWQTQALQKAVEAADRGVFVSGTAVDAWLDSWGTADELAPPRPDERNDGRS